MRLYLSRSIILVVFLFCCVGYWILDMSSTKMSFEFDTGTSDEREIQTRQMYSTKLSPDMSSTKMSFEFDTGISDDMEIQTTEPSDALILTYMRSGSSFTGRLLACRNDTFYWYEPLLSRVTFEYFSDDGQVCSYGKPYCRNVPETERKSLETALNFLLNIYKCNNLMQYFPIEPLGITGKQRVAGASGKVFEDCRSDILRNCTICKNAPTKCKNCTTDAEQCKPCSDVSRLSLKPCYENFMERCPVSEHRATKVLRMATANAKYLLLQHKRLKLIQIFRDPRGTLNSRIKTGWYYKPSHNFTLLEDAKTLCMRMEKDIAAAKDLKMLFPDRVKILQYEDFNDPFKLATILYSFLNMRLTQTARSFLTKTSENGGKGFHPDSFRYELDWDTVQHIDKTCHNVLESLGLWTFKSKDELLNTSLNILSSPRPFTLEG